MKKVLSLVLAVVLVLGMTSMVSAKETLKRTEWRSTNSQSASDIPANVSLEDAYTYESQFGTLANFPSNVTPVADQKIKFDLNRILAPINFTVGASKISTSMLSGDDWGVGYKIVKGAQIISKCDLDKTNARVVFNKYFTYTKDIDFEVELWLTNNKTRIKGSEITVSGTYVADDYKVDIDSDDTYYYIGDGTIVKATEYIRDIELDLDHDVSIFTKLFQDKKYYGIANEDASDSDITMFEKYPQLENVYNLVTSGLAGSGNIVKFNMDDNLYVYSVDADGNLFYVGRTKDRLPYYSKYYVSSKEVDIADEDVVDGGTAPTDVSDIDVGNVSGGGDDIEDFVNDNPGTGC